MQESDLYLINKGGRLVPIASQELYDSCIKQGFTIPTQEQINSYKNELVKLIRDQSLPESEKSIYFATVAGGTRDGYGTASTKLLASLREHDITITQFNKGQKIGFLFHSPESALRMENPVKIIYTMFESDKIPDSWKEYLDTADVVVVPSHWCMEVFAKAGVTAQVIPLGYDDKIYKYIERPEKKEGDPFVFVHYNAFNMRKGFLEVLKAFLKAFDKSENVKMIFKTTLLQPPIPLNPYEYPNIEVKLGAVEDNEILSLLGQSDCFVFPSRGEGFGMTPLEAMATGLPAIIPNAHGISEYFNPECMYEAPLDGMTPAVYSRFKDQDVGNMTICDINKLAQQMRYVFDHQEEARAKGKLASEYVKQWTYDKTAIKFKTLFDEWLGKEITPKPLTNILPLEQIV